jgi:hypothetical protein
VCSAQYSFFLRLLDAVLSVIIIIIIINKKRENMHTIIIIVIIVIIILVITFVQGFYNYIPEINYVSRVYSVAAVLYLQFALHVMLLRP